MAVGVVATPLVGRSEETACLWQLIDAASGGVGGGIVIIGEPGAGKTSLVEVASAAAATGGLAVYIGRAEQLEVERTLGAALDAFGLRLDELAGPAAATRTVLEAGANAAAGYRLADRMLEVVEASCARGPLLLAVEDLHWADPATLAWLRAVLERAPTLPLAVLATTRPPSAGSAAYRAVEALAVSRLDLGPLTPEDVRALVVAVLGAEPGPELAGALDAAAGNPLLVLAALDASANGGRPEHGVVAARLRELDTAALRTVRVAAVLGATVDPAMLATVAGARSAHVLADLDDAAAAGLLVVTDEGYAFRHELYRDAVLTGLGEPAAAALHLDAARTLAVMGAPATVVAEHFAQGASPGDREAVSWLERAALDVVAVAPAGALRLVDVALGLCGNRPPVGLLLARVRALAGAGRVSEADALGRSLLRDGLEPATERRLRRELAFTAFLQGRAADSVAEMERCGALTLDPALRARVQGEIAFSRFLAVDHIGARASGELAIAEGQRFGDVAAQVAGGAVLCFLDLFANSIPAATRHAHHIVELADQPGAAEAHVFQPWFIASILWLETDRFDRLAATARRGREVAAERGSAWAIPGYDAVGAFGALRTGAFDDAAAAAEATLGYLDGVDGFGVAVWCHAFLAQVALHHGEFVVAEHHVGTAEAWLARGDRAQLGFEQLRIAAARLHELRGELDAARTALAEVWDLFVLIGVRSPLSAFGVPLARLARLAGDSARPVEVAAALDEAATASETLSVRVTAELAAAWRDVDPDRALAAAAHARRTQRPPLVAGALADAADLLRIRRRRAEADRVAAEAAQLWAAMGADADAAACAATSHIARPIRSRPRTGIAAVTGTERAVIGLLAGGLANAEIAARLGISRRTVESHVSAAYRKLEVSSRVELARAALNHGLGD